MTAITYPISLRVKMIRETEQFLEANLPVNGLPEVGQDEEPQDEPEGVQPAPTSPVFILKAS